MKLPLPNRFVRLCTPGLEGYAEIGTRQVYIFPTGNGFLFALLLCLMLIGSINYGNNLGFFLTFLLAGLGLVCMVHTWRNLIGLRMYCGEIKPVFKGEQATIGIELINHRCSERADIRLEFDKQTVAECDLSEQANNRLELLKKADRRGLQKIPQITASTRYPLGLFTAWSYVQLDSEIIVYPAPGTLTPFSQQPTYKQSNRGDKGVGVEDFVGLRTYRQGDSPRHIHWKAAAREQELQTKQFGGDRSEQIWLDWKQLVEGDTETKLSSLCRGILVASKQELEYGLRLPDREIPPASDISHRNHCLETLALYGDK